LSSTHTLPKELTALPRLPNWIWGKGREEKMRERGKWEGKGKGRKGEGKNYDCLG